MKLISMVDYVKNQYKTIASDNIYLAMKNCNEYANLLKQPLELWMFVTCDEKGNVLIELDQNNTKYDICISNDEVDCDYRLYDDDCLEYQQAKERCLFDGWKFEHEFPGSIVVVNQ